jgi:hypothetical protein
MLMRHRQEEFRKQGPSFYYLSSDASLQRGGQDFQLTLEDSILMEHAARIFHDAGEFDADSWNSAELLRTTCLLASLLGSANSVIAGKYEAFDSANKLDVGLTGMSKYGASVVSFCADYGTESKFCDAPCLHMLSI